MAHMNSSRSMGFIDLVMTSEGCVILDFIFSVISDPVSRIGYFPYFTRYLTI